MATKVPTLKTETYGSCYINRLGPSQPEELPKVLSVMLSYEEALKLNVSLQSQLMDMSRMNRAKKDGRDAAVNLMIHTGKMRLVLGKGKVGAEKRIVAKK